MEYGSSILHTHTDFYGGGVKFEVFLNFGNFAKSFYRMRIPISIKLIVYFLIISISSIFIVGKFSWFETKEAIIDRTYQQLRSIRVEKEKSLIQFFNQLEADLNYLASDKFINLLDTSPNYLIEQNLSPFISGYLQSKAIYANVLYLYDSSVLFNSNPDSHLLVDAHNTLTKKTILLPNCHSLSDSIRIIDTITSNSANYIIACKQIDAHKRILIFINHYVIDNLIFTNNPHNGLGKSGEVYLVGSDFLMRSSSRFIENASYEINVNTDAVINAFENKPGEAQIEDYRGIKVLSSYKKVDVQFVDWVILAEIDYSEATEQIRNIENNIIFLSIVISLILLGVIATLSTSFTSPIRKLKLATEKIVQGEFTEILISNKNDEITDLMIAFNYMNNQLKEQKEVLEYEQVIKSTLVIDSQEEERQRLSRELHDSLGQSVLAIKLKMEHLLLHAKGNQEIEIKECLLLIADTIKEIRLISNNLMPSVLQQYGLITAIENLALWANNESNCVFTFTNLLESSSLNKKMEIYLYRIVQEAFNNSIKHGKASEFDVKLSENQNFIYLNLTDNGIGTSLDNNAWKRGNGLNNMKERVNLLSGLIKMDSTPKNGFSVSIEIPI
jgi:signal transduction histidine kinase